MIDRSFTVAITGDAAVAAALFCVDPVGTGGIVLRGSSGPARDAWLQLMTALMPAGSPVRSIPLNIQDDRLLGGIDLTATLRMGRPVAQQGVLADADGGVVVLHTADRLSERTAGHIAAVLDTRQVVTERHGLATRLPGRIGVVAFDGGVAQDERPPASLLDRLAIQLDLADASSAAVHAPEDGWTRGDVAAARERLPAIQADDELRQALCQAADALGVESIRAPLLALRVARASAALNGRATIAAEDAAAAARLVLAPRATTLPAAPPEQEEAGESGPSEAQESAAPDTPGDTDQTSDSSDRENAVADTVLEAALASLPAGLLDALKGAPDAKLRSQRAGRVGIASKGGLRGRPAGVRPGEPRGGARLNLMETLRAAAPWQAIRRRDDSAVGASAGILVRREDFRVSRFKQRSETTTVFAVDASGSAALHRLAEAKGAVELLLADCYVRRDSVALIAFRGASAHLLLPPTRSLVRAKRSLADLAGGGGTPLAAAIDATWALAEAMRRRGCTPVAVLLTDGRANVSRDGSGGRPRAIADALDAARRMRAAGIRTLLLDTSPQAQDAARLLATEMGATYLPLPHADASSVSRLVQASARAATASR